jgi:hypothetical protein
MNMQRHDFFYQKTTFKRSVAATAIVPSDTGQASQESKPLKGYCIDEQRAPQVSSQIGARKAGRVHEVAACRKRLSRAV